MTAALTAARQLAARPHRHDGQTCHAHHHLVRRPDGQLVRVTSHHADPSLIRLPDGWTLTGELWA